LENHSQGFPGDYRMVGCQHPSLVRLIAPVVHASLFYASIAGCRWAKRATNSAKVRPATASTFLRGLFARVPPRNVSVHTAADPPRRLEISVLIWFARFAFTQPFVLARRNHGLA
jgi:hypothetical protein